MEASSSNAALMRRIVQLESERDDLRKDVETLCMQQSGQQSLASTLMAPLQARRVTGLEQDLDSCRQKVSMYQRENANLQDELSEIYHIKSQVSDLCKIETEKNKKLEDELKFFQSKAAASMNERDRLLVEMERVRKSEQALQGELRDCQRLNEELVQESEAMKVNAVQLQSEFDIYTQVIKKFWQFRGAADTSSSSSEMARSLLSDPDESWTFGNFRHFEQKVESLETTTAAMKKELAASKADSARLLLQLSNEVRSREEATIHASMSQERQLECEVTLRNSAEVLTNLHKSMKEDIRSILVNEMRFFEDAIASFEEFLKNHKADEPSLSTTGSRVISDTSDTATSSEASRNAQPTVSQDAFLQALQEKVSALMLLSQEEERHHLEVVTTGALEYQLRELNQTLSQVTLEKVEALMEVAQLKYNLQELRDRERDLLRLLEKPSVGGRLLPASWAGQAEPPAAAAADSKQQSKKPSSTGGYLKSWLRGGDLYGFISSQSESKASQTEADKPADWARSRVENAALRERMSSLQQLIKTAKRLQSTLAGADGSSDSESVMSSLSVVNRAVEEAQRLKAAVSCCGVSSLPLSWGGGDAGKASGDDRAVVELVSAAGLALVELLLATADLQRQCLVARLSG